MNVTVIGCGYVGLVTGACLAEIGHTVVCSDNDLSKIDTLNRGSLPIYELSLEDMVARNRQAGRLSFTGNLGEAVRAGEAIFICVGTPPLESGDADLTAINRVAQLIAAEAQRPKLVIEKSTVPVQTGQQLKRALAVYSRNRGLQFRIASNPEFLREGTAVLDFMHPTRVVVGVEDPATEQELREIYRPLLERRFHCPVHDGQCPTEEPPAFIVTTINSAELIKHASNSFLAVKISYANLLADICERMDANVEEVTRAVGLDPRIGREFLRPGLGFGGFCLPKDIQAFIHLGSRAGVDMGLLQAAETVNRRRIDHFVDKIRDSLWVMREKPVGVLGLSFKANTDDVRFSPAIALVSRLLAEGVDVRAYDPQAMTKAPAVLPRLTLATNEYEAAEDAEALIIATEWQQFKALDWKKIFQSMARPLVFDTRNLLEPEQMERLGFEYYSVGRGKQAKQAGTA